MTDKISIANLRDQKIECASMEADSQRSNLFRFSKIKSNLVDLPASIPSLNNFFEPLIQYNGNYDRDADNFTADAKKRYIEADRDYFKKTSQNMSIHSGKRSVSRQAELFVLYKWHNQGNPASWPGCSFHNWGLAADMIRTDEANIVSSMNNGGWTRTVGDEGWHFECTSSSDHGKASEKIKAFRKTGSGLAYKWSDQIAHFYIKSKKYNDRAPTFNVRLEGHRQVAQSLQADLDTFNQRVQNLQTRIDAHNQNIGQFNSELGRARRLLADINNLPNGPERNRKIREYNALAAWLEQRSDTIDNEGKRIDLENSRLSVLGAQIDARISAYESEDAWLSQEFNQLQKLEKEIPKHQGNANTYLSKIESEVP